ncbi:MAG: ubiquinone/menaquinone biosynthesis methyltransferase [Verrucomicrobiales bacterium]|jgi:ubiquinone/menaquinone biosynthesis methyltransferase
METQSKPASDPGVFRPTLGEELDQPESKRELNLEIFTRIAREYDLICKLLSFGRDLKWKQKMVRLLPDKTEPYCIDLATGTGDLSFYLGDRYPDGSVVGIDLTEKMIEVANGRNEQKNVSFEIGDMAALEVADGSADIVTGGYALRNAPILREAIREVRRILKPDGVAVFLDFSKPKNKLGQFLNVASLKFWASLWGLVLHRRPWVYGYIADSLHKFPDRDALERIFVEEGFELVERKLHFFGVMEKVVLRKRPE